MENSNEEGKLYRPGISDLDDEVVPGVTVSQFLHMSDEGRKEILDVLREKNPELAKEEDEYLARAKEITPGLVELFKKVCKNNEGESN